MGNSPETVVDLFLSGVRNDPNPRLLNYKSREGRWIPVSAREASERVRRIALGLYSLGIRPGDRLALLSENRPEWIFSDLGILSIGAVDVPIYTAASIPQIEFILSHSDPKAVLVSSRALYERVLPLLVKRGEAQKVIVFERGLSSSDMLTLAYVEQVGETVDHERPLLYDELKSRLKSSDLATLVYTSTETGEPKGVMLTHGNIVSNVLSCAAWFRFDSKTDTALSYLPLSHMFERSTLYHYMHSQVPVYFAESVEHMPDYLLEVRPTLMTTVPRFLEKAEERMLARIRKMPVAAGMLMKLVLWAGRRYDSEYKLRPLQRLLFVLAEILVFRSWRARFGGRFRFIICGGAKLRPEVCRMFTAVGIPVLQGYGLTETAPVVAVNRPEKNRFGSVGCVLPGVEVKIAGDGEIWVRGPNVTRGYYKNPQADAAVFEDGWFKTGDVGMTDRDGFLHVTDRKKDLFKTSGGKFIAPQAIETLLCANPFVGAAAVVGEGRKFACALIFPNFQALKQFAAKNKLAFKSEKDLTRNAAVKKLYERIVNEANKQLAHWETIKKFSIIPDPATYEFPKEAKTVKARRKMLEEKYRRVIESLYLREKSEAG